MKKNCILSSIMILVLCFALISGATFALFTSESTVNIAVTSGKVEVVASVEDLTLYSMGNEVDEFFENGGKAEYNAQSNKLILDKVTPGDKVNFTVKIDNKSNVKTQYRVCVQAAEASKLLEGLKVTIDETTYSSFYSYKTAWALLDANKDIEDVKVSIELPKEAGNEYQDLTAALSITVEAIQGNGEVQGEAEVVNFVIVDDAVEFRNVFTNNTKAVAAQKLLVVLANDIAYNANDPITISANQVVELNLNGKNIAAESTATGKNRHAFTVKGEMEVTGEGTITFKHNAENMGWGNLTAAFSVEGGNLTLNEGVQVVNLGGSNMAYAVDVNTTGGESVLNINGATLISTYTAVRIFNNNQTKNGTVNLIKGSVVGASRDIWVHNPSAKAVDENGIVKIANSYQYEETVQNASSFYGRIYQFAGKSIPANDPLKLDEALSNGSDVTLLEDVKFNASETKANSGYGATGLSVKGGTFDGNGNTLTVTGASGTWDSAIHTTGGTIKNVVAAGAMRGIFMGGATADVYIDNVSFNTIYTFNSDAGSKEYGVYISNSTMNGWTSYSNCHKEVVFTNCIFTEGKGYAFLRAYNNTEFKNCKFDASVEFELEVTDSAIAIFENCYYGDILITAENIGTLGLLYNTPLSRVTVK